MAKRKKAKTTKKAGKRKAKRKAKKTTKKGARRRRKAAKGM
jgi:hypothetical protein